MAEQPDLGNAYLVIMDRGGVFGAYLSEDKAIEQATAIDGVVVEVPVVADFRWKSPAVGFRGECDHGFDWKGMSYSHYSIYHKEDHP